MVESNEPIKTDFNIDRDSIPIEKLMNLKKGLLNLKI